MTRLKANCAARQGESAALWRAELDAALEHRFTVALEGEHRAQTELIEKHCQSPIERRLAPWLLSLQTFLLEPPTIYGGNIDLDTAVFGSSGEGDAIAVFAQVRVAQYTADFVVVAHYASVRQRHTILVAVECDGHEFHNRTKEQAEHDRRRDRAFQALGLHVFRFTGREIARDAAKCAEEVADFFQERLYRAAGLLEQRGAE